MVLKFFGREYVLMLLGLLVLSGLTQLPTVPMCPMAALLHHPCPTCGVVRGLWHLMHGDTSGAIRYNPISVLITIALMRRICILKIQALEKIQRLIAHKNVDRVFLFSFFAMGLYVYLR